MFSIVYTIVPPGEPYDFIVPPVSPIKYKLLEVLASQQNTTMVKTLTVYDNLFQSWQKGVGVSEVAEGLGVSKDTIRDLLADGEIVGWRVKARVIVSTESVIEFLKNNEWY